MTKLAPAMHSICERKAKEKGPRVKMVNGEYRAVFCLTREELAKEFGKCGYKRERVAWLKVILEFRDIWDEITPKESVLMDPAEKDWFVIFVNLTKSEETELRMFAEDNQIRSLGVEA